MTRQQHNLRISVNLSAAGILSLSAKRQAACWPTSLPAYSDALLLFWLSAKSLSFPENHRELYSNDVNNYKLHTHFGS